MLIYYPTPVSQNRRPALTAEHVSNTLAGR